MGGNNSKEEQPKSNSLCDSIGNGNEKNYKITLIGGIVGKTSILMRFIKGNFGYYDFTIGACFSKKYIHFLDSDPVILNIWDTSGSEISRELISSYYLNVHAVLLFFDITNSDTYSDLVYWVPTMKHKQKDEGTIIFVVGNMLDKEEERQVMKQQALADAQKNTFFYFEVSALTGEGVIELFTELALKLKNNKWKT